MQPKIKMTQRKLDTLEKQHFCQQSNKQTRLIRKEKTTEHHCHAPYSFFNKFNIHFDF
jgi:hypothetical protein